MGSPAEEGVPEVKRGCFKCSCVEVLFIRGEVTIQCDASKSGLGAALV